MYIIYLFFLIVETIQYSLLYSVIGTPFAYYNNKIFPIKDEKKGYNIMLLEIILHVISLSVLFLLLKFIVQQFPFILKPFTEGYYIPYSSEEYAASVSAYILFFYLQVNLTDKITLIGEKLYKGEITISQLFF